MMCKYTRIITKMKPSIFWKLMALVHQTNQYDTGRANLVYNNFSTPLIFNSSYALRREKREVDYVPKHTVSIMKNTRFDNFRYFIDFNMGNPPQHIIAELSLKYRGIYIVSGTRISYSLTDYFMSLWRARPREGVLNPRKSQSYKVHNTEVFTTTSEFYGTSFTSYAQDDFYIGVTILEEGQFIVMHEAPESSMIGLGLSPGTSQFVTKQHDKEEATNIFNQMKIRGWTNKAAFSIWIGSEDSSSSGMILFNAVNYKYALGDLYVFPLIYVKGRKGYYIKLDGINIVGLDGRTTEAVKLSVTMEIDFERPYTTFPLDVVKIFYYHYHTNPIKLFKVSCENESQKGAIGLVFSGVQYVFPYLDILPHCHLGRTISDPPFYPGERFVLGANFISTLFMVFDMDKREVGIAIANTDVEPAIIDNEPFLGTISGTRAPLFSSSNIQNSYSIVGTYYSTMQKVTTVMKKERTN